MKKTIIFLIIAITTIGCVQKHKVKTIDKTKSYPDTVYLMFYDDYTTMSKSYFTGQNIKDTLFIHYMYTLPSGFTDSFMPFEHRIGKDTITYLELDYFNLKGIEVKDPLWNINKYKENDDYFKHNQNKRKYYIIEVDLQKKHLKKIEVIPDFQMRM